jgi:hypothetical protein
MQVPFFRPPVAPLQFVEQQSAAEAQASPSVAQVDPVGPDGRATHFEPKPHTPEQHCVSLAQDWSTWRHTVEEQVAPGLPAFGQFREQHCASEPQASPGQAHTPPSARHLPPEHTAEQHWESAEHVAPGSRQDGVGGEAHRCALQ